MKRTRLLAIASSAILLSACSSYNLFGTGGHSSQSTIASSACSGNRFLQKYDCSIVRITTAARHGDADAQYALGYMYYYGIGTVRDENTAAMWINKAASQGQPLAMKAKRMIDSGGRLHHGTYAPGGYNAGGGRRGGGSSLHQKKEDVVEMNTQSPNKPIAEHLPAYKNKDKNVKRAPVLETLKRKPAEATTPAAPSEPTSAAPIKNKWSNAEKWMMKQPAKGYSLQLMGGTDLAAIKSFITRNKLKGSARYYSANLHGKKWYMLVYGEYNTAHEAQIAAKSLPQAIRARHPWVKPFAIIQKEIKDRRIVS